MDQEESHLRELTVFLSFKLTKCPTLSSLHFKRTMCDAGVLLSVRRNRRRLQKDFKLPAGRPSRKPMLTMKQRRMRFQFRRLYMDKSKEWWGGVMFADESLSAGPQMRLKLHSSAMWQKVRFEVYCTDCETSTFGGGMGSHRCVWSCWTKDLSKR